MKSLTVFIAQLNIRDKVLGSCVPCFLEELSISLHFEHFFSFGFTDDSQSKNSHLGGHVLKGNEAYLEPWFFGMLWTTVPCKFD